MNARHLILASLKHHWRIHVAVALGVIAATAVLTGALIVGDSVRGSLRNLTLQRLGRISHVLLTDQFFRTELVDEIAAGSVYSEHFVEALPAILLPATIERPNPSQLDAARRAGGVTLVGCTKDFWELGEGGPKEHPQLGQIVLNEPLADEIGASVGEEVLLRIPLKSDIPSESLLGEKTETLVSRRLEVSEIIPAQGLGRFGLSPSQQLPYCAFVSIEEMQAEAALDQPGKANAILVATDSLAPAGSEADDVLQTLLREEAKPADLGLSMELRTIGSGEAPASRYIDITSNRMLLPAAVVEAAHKAFPEEQLQPVLTYLANTIKAGGKTIPYSTVAGVDPADALGPYELSGQETLADDEIVLNSWAAESLGAAAGDAVTISYYEPESTHGQLTEPSPASFRVRAVAPLAKPDQSPTQANDPFLTPELKGVTDQASIDEWDLPFELKERIRREDEDYWDDFRTTPKAFISLARARELWSSRFGDTTSLRLPADGDRTPASVFEALDLDLAELGLAFQPVKREALEASSGTTPFNLLFIGFSFFIIAAAVMLTMLLFRLGVEQRAAEVGILQAVGVARTKIGLLLAAEGGVVAALAGAAGTAAGVGYAWLMLAGLRTWWVQAITTPFLSLHVTPLSLALGYMIGVVVSVLAIIWALWRLRYLSVRQLLAGKSDDPLARTTSRSRLSLRFAQGAFILAVLIALLALQLRGEAQAGAFFGSGFLVLAALLTWIQATLRQGIKASGEHKPPGTSAPASTPPEADASSSPLPARFNLFSLALRNGARNPGRSTLTIGLVAAASFLIIAISAFRLETSAEGTGGFDLVAQSDDPIIYDLNTGQGRFELALTDDDSDLLSLTNIYSLRLRAGDDASCKNLYRPQEPRILGLPQAMRDRGGFAWAASAATTGDEARNPWLLLEKDLPDDAIPVVLDAATATYSLKPPLDVGDRYAMQTSDGQRLEFQVVGLLKNSIFQGALLISEDNFLSAFPHITGYRYFLVEALAEEALYGRVEPRVSEIAHKMASAFLESPTPFGSQAKLAQLNAEANYWLQLADDPTEVAARAEAALESSLGQRGFDAVSAEDRLAGFLAVQNTYLSTFQSLGALGLLLGTFGLATVQLRGVLERRGELALMRATGIRRSALARLVLWENALLLLGGLGVGIIAAAVAVLPHMLLGGASVPFMSLAVMLGLVLAIGTLAGIAAVRAVLRAPLLSALRGE